MAGIVVALTGDGVQPVTHRSNIGGWANFSVSTSDHDAIIRTPGIRRFTVLPPEGWCITSGNSVQDADFESLDGSVGGLTLNDGLTNVGLAPELAVSGKLVSPSSVAVEGGSASLLIEANSISTDLRFRIPVAAGSVTLDAGTVSRRVSVSETPVEIGLLDPQREISSVGENMEINFEAVSELDICKIASGYGGLDWKNFNAVKTDYYQGEGYVNGSATGAYVAYNSSGLPAEIANAKPFDFVGCFLSAAWLDAEGETLTIEARRNERVIARDRVVLSALGGIRYEPRLAGVTSLRFVTAHHRQFVLDSLTIGR